MACANSSNQPKCSEKLKLTFTQLWTFNKAQRLSKAAHETYNLEPIPGSKRKKVRKTVNTRWLSLRASGDEVYGKYVKFLETFFILETEGATRGSMAKLFF